MAHAIPIVERQGRALVQLGGRTFTVHRASLEDLRAQQQKHRIAELKRALLVMHSPTDATAGIGNAGRIYATARHPKSFISLDGADHLLTWPADARYAADVLAAWASRYVHPDRDRHDTGLLHGYVTSGPWRCEAPVESGPDLPGSAHRGTRPQVTVRQKGPPS